MSAATTSERGAGGLVHAGPASGCPGVAVNDSAAVRPKDHKPYASTSVVGPGVRILMADATAAPGGEVRGMRFHDRADAGRQLAWRLRQERMEAPVVVGLPRGGVLVAAEVARALGAPLDVLVVRKLGCPWQPELALGALGEDGAIVLNQPLISSIGLPPHDLTDVIRAEAAQLARRLTRYRGARPAVPVQGRTVVVVDDGLATGVRARAAIQVLRRRGARRVVLAVPVAPPETVTALRGVADAVVALGTPRAFLAIGQFYDDFTQISDQEVTRLLGAREPTPAMGGATGDDDAPARASVIELGPVRLARDLATPARPVGMVVFAPGGGSARHSSIALEIIPGHGSRSPTPRTGWPPWPPGPGQLLGCLARQDAELAGVVEHLGGVGATLSVGRQVLNTCADHRRPAGRVLGPGLAGCEQRWQADRPLLGGSVVHARRRPG